MSLKDNLGCTVFSKPTPLEREPAPASIPNVKKVSAASLHLVDKQGDCSFDKNVVPSSDC